MKNLTHGQVSSVPMRLFLGVATLILTGQKILLLLGRTLAQEGFADLIKVPVAALVSHSVAGVPPVEGSGKPTRVNQPRGSNYLCCELSADSSGLLKAHTVPSGQCG